MSTIISISGVESSGKSSLTNALKAHYNCESLEEQSRIYLKVIGSNYVQKDLIEIAKLYLQKLKTKLDEHPKLVIVDTSILDILIWSEIKYQNIDPKLNDFLRKEPKLFYLLCSPDIEYEADPLRESPTLEKRLLIHDAFLKRLNAEPNYLGSISGHGKKRINNAIETIESQITF